MDVDPICAILRHRLIEIRGFTIELKSKQAKKHNLAYLPKQMPSFHKIKPIHSYHSNLQRNIKFITFRTRTWLFWSRNGCIVWMLTRHTKVISRMIIVLVHGCYIRLPFRCLEFVVTSYQNSNVVTKFHWCRMFELKDFFRALYNGRDVFETLQFGYINC